MTREDRLTEMRDEILARLKGVNALGLVEDYWMLRAELVSRSRTETVNYAAEKVADGQISICYETADMIRQTREADEEQANSATVGTISAKGASVV